MFIVEGITALFILLWSFFPYPTSSQCTKYASFVSSVSDDCSYWTEYTAAQGWDQTDQQLAGISCAERCKATPACDYGIMMDYSSCTLPSRCFLMGGCVNPYQSTWTSCSDTIYPYECINLWTNTTTTQEPSPSPTDITSNPTTPSPNKSPIEIPECTESYVSFTYDLSNDCAYLMEYTEAQGWDNTDQESAEISCAKQCNVTDECNYGIFIDYVYDSQVSKLCDKPTKCILMGNCDGGSYRDIEYSCDEIIYNYGCVVDFSDPDYGKTINTDDGGFELSDTALTIIIIGAVVACMICWKCTKYYLKKQHQSEKAEEQRIKNEELQRQRAEQAEIDRIERQKREKEYAERQLQLAQMQATQTNVEPAYDDYDDHDDYDEIPVNSGYVKGFGGGGARGGYNNDAERERRRMERKQKDLENKQKQAAKKQNDAMKKAEKQAKDAAKKQQQEQNKQLKAQCKKIQRSLPRMNQQNMCNSCGQAFGSGGDNVKRKNQHMRKCRNTHHCPCGKTFKDIKKYYHHLGTH